MNFPVSCVRLREEGWRPSNGSFQPAQRSARGIGSPVWSSPPAGSSGMRTCVEPRPPPHAGYCFFPPHVRGFPPQVRFCLAGEEFSQFFFSQGRIFFVMRFFSRESKFLLWVVFFAILPPPSLRSSLLPIYQKRVWCVAASHCAHCEKGTPRATRGHQSVHSPWRIKQPRMIKM